MLGGLISFFLLYIYTGGNISSSVGAEILPNIAVVSSTLFAIVLTGFTIITSFTDHYFLYAWKEVGEFDGIVTLFQYNLTLPIIVILGTLALFIQYNGLAMIVLISLFVYMILSLLDLVAFISKYSLQRAEFVSQLVEKSTEHEQEASTEESSNLSIEQLEEVNEQLSKLQKIEEGAED